MAKTMIKRKSMALLLTGAYALFAFLAIKSVSHAGTGRAYAAMPVATTIAYVFCAYFFIEIQRKNSNIFENVMAWSSAGVFVARLVPFLHIAFPSIQSYVVAASYLAVTLIVIATIALILRTIQLFTESRTADEGLFSRKQRHH